MTIPRVHEIMRPALSGTPEFEDDTLTNRPSLIVAADASLLDAARLFSMQRVTCAAVIYDGQQVGWLSARDIVQALARYARQIAAGYQPRIGVSAR